ncbi:MAG: hypothetical protein K8F30_14915, partial [Taibaiella sp.]|nr:hypothetical protein [Taibaiella sp.]
LMRIILIILFCFFSWSRVHAQEGVTGHQTLLRELTPGVADDIFDPQKAVVYERRNFPTRNDRVVQEVNLKKPANQYLDSVFNIYGDVRSIVDVIKEPALRKKIPIYAVIQDSLEKLALLDIKALKNDIDGVNSKLDRLVMVQLWSYIDSNHYFVPTTIAIGLGYSNNEMNTAPIFWVRYNDIERFLWRYKYIDERGKTERLTKYFEELDCRVVHPGKQYIDVHVHHRKSNSIK